MAFHAPKDTSDPKSAGAHAGLVGAIVEETCLVSQM